MMLATKLLLLLLQGNKVCTQFPGWGNASFLTGQGQEYQIVCWGP